MTQLNYEILDVFTDTSFAGNALAVVKVKDTQDLDAKQMQTIAREFNLSETAFVFATNNPAHSARVRIFTPTRELPFAGHPTVGTAVSVAITQLGDVSGQEDAIVVLEEKVGPIRIGVRFRPQMKPFAEFDIPKMPTELEGETPTNDELSLVLGLATSEIGFENHRPSCFEAGMPFVFIPVRNIDVISRAVADTKAMEKLLGTEHQEVYLYCRETVKASSSFHARMFAPTLGITEDPATGAAAAAFAGVVMKYDQPSGGTKNYIIEQGFEMNRPSEIHLELVVDEQLKNVRIGGHVVKVASGALEL